MDRALFTIGHSNHTETRLVELLRLHGVEAVLDVRSTPNSRFSPHFNREQLSTALSGQIRYAWLGDLLGGRPPAPGFYDEAGHVLYGPLSRTPEFLRGISQLESNSGRYVIALLCSEQQPSECHRHLLIARTLRDRGFDGGSIRHILSDGSILRDNEIPEQARLLEDAWRSPLSVLPAQPLAPFSHA